MVFIGRANRSSIYLRVRQTNFCQFGSASGYRICWTLGHFRHILAIHIFRHLARNDNDHQTIEKEAACFS